VAIDPVIVSLGNEIVVSFLVASNYVYGTAAPVPSIVEITFDQIYRLHVRFVWRTLRMLGVPDALVEDAVQDVFVVVHRRMEDFQASSSAKAWVYQIARRVARDYRRNLRRRGGQDALSEGVADDRPDATAHVEQLEAVHLLEDLLAKLDDKGREVLVLTELEEIKPPQLAELLEVPLNTVYSRLRRARLAFNRLLERHKEQGA